MPWRALVTIRPLVIRLALLAALAPAPARAERAVVRAVLLYSPTCPHCHRLMADVLPPLQERYGSRLRLAYVDVTRPEGRALWGDAIRQYAIPQERQGVPTLLVASTVLVGEDEIPARLPGLIEANLATGGLAWPALPGIAPLVAAAEPPPAGGFPRLPDGAASVAILGAVLGLLVFQAAHAALTWSRRPAARAGSWRRVTPLLVLASLGVALYLAGAELRGTHVACMSDCDAVHSSEWAWLFGVVPVGAFGAFGAGSLLAAWAAGHHPEPRIAARGGAAFLFLSLFGLAFSIYLTFLELFVIGAMCEWCVANALLMSAVAALNLAPGKRALDEVRGVAVPTA
jgi:uncharacterized membrane protein